MAKCTVNFNTDAFKFKDYTVEFEATATAIHEPMVMYYKDGSGYPGYDGIEDYEWTILSVTDSDGNILERDDNGYPITWLQEQKDELDSEIESYLDDVEWNYPEEDCEC